jgi:hypothetical protein
MFQNGPQPASFRSGESFQTRKRFSSAALSSLGMVHHLDKPFPCATQGKAQGFAASSLAVYINLGGG